MRAGVIRRPGSTHALPVLSERDRAGAFCVPHSVGVSRIRLSSAARSGDAARERVRWAGPLGTSHQHVHLACTTHMSVSHDMHVPRCPPRLASPRSRLGYNIVQYSPRSLARQAHEGRPCGAPFGAWLAALLLRFFFPTHHPAYSLAISIFPCPVPRACCLGVTAIPPHACHGLGCSSVVNG